MKLSNGRSSSLAAMPSVLLAVGSLSAWLSGSLVAAELLTSEMVSAPDGGPPYDPLTYVNQLIGSDNGGNVFAGASLPYGMAKAVADTNSPSNQGGFTTDGSNITGFSTMHDSGTGGSPSLGNFAFFPYSSCINNTVDGCTYNKNQRAIPFLNNSLVAQPGYFKLQLASGVVGEMTTTAHTSLFRFNFGKSTGNPLLLLDLTDLSDSRQDNATIAVDPTTGRMTGGGRFLPSFGSGNYQLYYCADFQGGAIHDTGIFVNSRANTSIKSLQINRGINSIPLPGGAFVRFQSPPNDTALARIGVSFLSSSKACQNAESEIPDYNFASVQSAAEKEWRQKLSPITVNTNGVDRDYLVNFYSSIYRTMLNPQNYTGENPLWQSSEPYWDSFYCLWDSFRSQIPFLTILDPSSVTQMVRALIDIWRHLGYMPDCRMSLCKGYTQGGSNADNIIVDAFVKNLTGGINYSDGLSAVKKDADVEPYAWSNEGRGGLDSWDSLNYIPVQDFDYKGFGTVTRSISRTLEYAYNDFCISELANALGQHSDADLYKMRSGNWRNLYKASQGSDLLNSSTPTGFTGFFQPKFLNGTWGFQDPLMCSNLDTSNDICSLQDDGPETFESSIWEYSFFVPHDQSSLISTYGGNASFVKRLTYLHDKQITYIGNEPAFLTVFQFHYAGRPGLSAFRSHYYIPSYFSTNNSGLPGNDDSGAMGSFVAFNMLGLFPNPGQDVYFISPPYFPSVSVTSPLTNKTATIKNTNWDQAYKNIYIQNATLNGKPYTKNWLTHDFFLSGGTLELNLGPTESKWGTAAADVPPSLGLGPAH